MNSVYFVFCGLYGRFSDDRDRSLLTFMLRKRRRLVFETILARKSPPVDLSIKGKIRRFSFFHT